MSDRERYKTVFCVPNEQKELASDMYDKIVKRLSESLSNKVLDVIQDGKEYIVRMGKPVAQEETDRMIHYRMYLDMKPLVRCKDCKHTPYSDNNDYWCDKWEREFGSDWFCADGVRKEKEDDK